MPTCLQPKCPFATTGVCLEGLKEGCPHLLEDTVELSEATAEINTKALMPQLTPEPFRFHSGEKLTPAEASRMMRNMQVRMVLCAGAQWAGKTTFLARIGEMFRNGSFKAFRFAGSKTLCAFERVTWLAAIPSGAAQPDTKRSAKTEQDTFYHIQVQRVGSTRKRVDLLITDMPGEIFPDVLLTKDVCDKQLAVARADYLILFVDCVSIIDMAKRHLERDMACRFLSRVQKGRHEPSTLQVTVVFSRWDKVLASESHQEYKDYCSIVEQDIDERFGTVFGKLSFERIAARPDPGSAQTNAEIQAIFGSWLDDPPAFTSAAVSRINKSARDFCTFGL